MKFFNKRREGQAKAGKEKARPIVLMVDEAGVKGLAFGLQWRSVVTSGGRASAIAMASAGGGTHFIFRGQQLGFGRLQDKNTVLPARVYPAAVIVAQQQVGDSLFVMQTGDDEFWIALTRNGAPTAEDSYLVGATETQAISLAHEIHANMQADDVNLSVFTNIDDHGFDSVKSASIEDILNGAVGDVELLEALPKPKSSIPKPVLLIAGIAIAALSINSGYKYWAAKKAKQEFQAAPVDEADDSVWSKTLAEWQTGIPRADRSGIQMVRRSIADVPVNWFGWALNGVTCAMDASAPKQQAPDRIWQCKASYTKTSSGLLNREMEGKAPAGWMLTFMPLTGLTAQWEIKMPIRTIDVALLKTQKEHLVGTASMLQSLAPAMSKSVEFAFKPISIGNPKKLDGTAYIPTKAIAGLTRTAISIQGPLRTIDATIEADLDVVWRALSVTVEANDTKLTLQTSGLTGELKGEIYANN
jgi:hypothetical protein